MIEMTVGEAGQPARCSDDQKSGVSLLTRTHASLIVGRRFGHST
jgi:hypothetical protein